MNSSHNKNIEDGSRPDGRRNRHQNQCLRDKDRQLHNPAQIAEPIPAQNQSKLPAKPIDLLESPVPNLKEIPEPSVHSRRLQAARDESLH